MRRRNIRFHILVKTGLVAQAIAHVARDEGNSDLSASWGRPSGERHKVVSEVDFRSLSRWDIHALGKSSRIFASCIV